MVRTIWRLFIWLLNFSLRVAINSLILSYRIISFLVPWLLRILWFFNMWMITTLLCTARGPGRSTTEMALYWQGNLLEAGFPRSLEDRLYQFMKVFAYLVVITGWIFIAGVTYLLASRFIDITRFYVLK